MMIDRTIRCWTVTKRVVADNAARLLRVKPRPPAAANLNNIRRLAAGVRSVPKPPAHYSLGLRARVLHAITPSAGGGPAAHPALHHVHGTRRIRSVCIVVGVGTLAGAVVGGTILSIGGGHKWRRRGRRRCHHRHNRARPRGRAVDLFHPRVMLGDLCDLFDPSCAHEVFTMDLAWRPHGEGAIKASIA